ncbi:MAG: hypothetical protein KC731_01660 [Myxococcales bacterium]|nr:hypothetical protein [Myxococcales bacterium]
MRRFVALWALALLVPLACGGYQPPTLGACGDGTPLSEADCPPDAFVAMDRCFDSRYAACGCISCSSDRCAANDSEPAEVSCALE